MLNKQGYGTILFGVLPTGEAKGLIVTDSVLRDVSRKIYERISPKIIPTVIKRTAVNKSILEVSFRGESKPYSVKGIYYYRENKTDRILSKEELIKVLGYGQPDSWDSRKISSPIDDLNTDQIGAFASKSSLQTGESPDPISYLEKESLLTQGKLTNAAKALFGKDKPLSMTMAVYATNETSTFLDFKRANGNLLDLIEEGYSYIAKNIRWVEEFNDEEKLEVPEIPLNAIREILLNSFDHSNYEKLADHRISIHPGFVSISSPGEFAAGYKPEDFLKGSADAPIRNPLIHKILLLAHEEESEKGLKGVFGSCKKARVGISYEMKSDTFSFSFRRKPLNVVPGISNRSSIDKDEEKLISLLKKQPHASINEISRLMNKSNRTIQRMLTDLKKKGYIKRIGNTRGYWRIN